MAARAWRNGRWVYRDGRTAERAPVDIPPPAVTAADVWPDINGWSARRVITWVGEDVVRARHVLGVEHEFDVVRVSVVRHCEKVLA